MSSINASSTLRHTVWVLRGNPVTAVAALGAALLMLTRFSTASRKGFAACQADAFVGNWLTVPIFFERRLPFSQKKKFHVLFRLSNTTLPLLFRCLTEASVS